MLEIYALLFYYYYYYWSTTFTEAKTEIKLKIIRNIKKLPERRLKLNWN